MHAGRGRARLCDLPPPATSVHTPPPPPSVLWPLHAAGLLGEGALSQAGASGETHLTQSCQTSGGGGKAVIPHPYPTASWDRRHPSPRSASFGFPRSTICIYCQVRTNSAPHTGCRSTPLPGGQDPLSPPVLGPRPGTGHPAATCPPQTSLRAPPNWKKPLHTVAGAALWAALALSTGEAAPLPPGSLGYRSGPRGPEPLRGAISPETFVHREHVPCLLTQRPENGFVLSGCLRGPSRAGSDRDPPTRPCCSPWNPP